MKFKKILAAIVTATMMSSMTLSVPSYATNNDNTINILLGDVDGDNGISNMDALGIYKYLIGKVNVTQRQLTAMDYNENGIIDYADYLAVFRISMMSNRTYKYRNNITPYALVNNESRTYLRHDCNSSSSSSSTSYTIYPATEQLSDFTNSRSAANLMPLVATDAPDTDETKIGYIRSSFYDSSIPDEMGSAYVVDDHVIMTSASRVYRGQFAQDITVKFYNSDCSSVTRTVHPSFINIPKKYVNPGANNVKEDYDYALLYVDADLSDYKVNLGVITNTGINSAVNATSTGFTNHNYSTNLERYSSNGTTSSLSGSSSAYRFKTSALSDSGKFGGMIHLSTMSDLQEDNVFDIVQKSNIGTICGSSSSDTYGIRITPTVLRAIFQNNNLEG